MLVSHIHIIYKISIIITNNIKNNNNNKVVPYQSKLCVHTGARLVL